MKRLLVVLGVAGVSLSAVFVRWSTAPSLVLVLYRMAFSVLLLLPSVVFRQRKELLALQRREVVLCLVSGIFLGLHFSAYFESLRWTSIAASVVLSDTEVLFVAVASLLLFRQKLSGKAWVAIALTLGGSIVVALADSTVGADVLKGNLLGLTAGATMAVYTMIGTVCRKTVSTTVYTFVVYLAAAVTVLVIALGSGTSIVGYGHLNCLTALGMAVFCTLLGHSVFSWGLKYLPPAFVSTVKLLEPVFASVWGLLLFAEVPALQVVLGGAAIIFGIALYSRSIETT